jgi:peptidoglycan/xylan/chitin deacetylase (PgdA/CDA1 family)
MRAVSLQYHDVIEAGDFDASGFPGPGPRSYKLEYQEFERQCAILSSLSASRPVTVLELLSSVPDGSPFLMTFDDGGISACDRILKVLDRYGWKAHFFIATDYIGKPAFVTPRQIRMLREGGHVIGSHSCSHPQRMSRQSWNQVLEEWTTSVRCLSDIVGEDVVTASVPHGYYSRQVAEAAAFSGIKALFTSEPVRSTHVVRGCTVFGRYVIRPGMDLNVVAELARGRASVWMKEYLFWNAKKVAKMVGGESYLKLRALLLPRSAH